MNSSVPVPLYEAPLFPYNIGISVIWREKPMSECWMKEVTVGPIGTCCYLVGQADRRDCVVIDPGAEAERILAAAEGREIAAILLTHGHFDHIGAVGALMEKQAPRLFVHPLDRPMLTDAALNASRVLLGRSITAPDATDLAREGDSLALAGLHIQVLHTPGHTPGSVCYRIGDLLFTGDTLFESGWGRTDLPGGSERDMAASLRRLIPLARNLPIYPGHA